MSHKNSLKPAQGFGRAQHWGHIGLIYPLTKQGRNRARAQSHARLYCFIVWLLFEKGQKVL